MQTEETLARAANLPVAGTEPTDIQYADTVEGKLQYLADLSLYYAAQAKVAKTKFKRDFYKKKQIKNNNKMYNLLVRTPNQFNPLMKYLAPHSPGKTTTDEVQQMHVQTVVGDNDIDSDAIVVYNEQRLPEGNA